MTLAELTPGTRARIETVNGDPSLLQRLSEFGIFEGEVIEFLGFAPLGDPLELRVGDSRLSLRKADAASITVTSV